MAAAIAVSDLFQKVISQISNLRYCAAEVISPSFIGAVVWSSEFLATVAEVPG
jgi:hypothetical protein